jgi:hypothetical protein
MAFQIEPTVAICALQAKRRLAGRRTPPQLRSCSRPDPPDDETNSEHSMYFFAGALAALSALFYAAGYNELGSLGSTMCEYGSVFCDKPYYVLVGAGLAAAWATFVSVR